jgi:hypothetical protein
MRKFTALPFLLLVASAFAATHKVPNDEPIATVEIPDKWQTAQRGEAIEASSPDGALHFLVTPVEQKKIAEAMGEAMRYIRNTGEIVVRPDTRKNETGTINGIDVQHVTWQGNAKSGDVKMQFTVFSLTKDKPLLAVYWGSPAAEKKYEADLKKMLESIRQA